MNQEGQEPEGPKTRTGPLCFSPLSQEQEDSPFSVGDEQVQGSTWLYSTPVDPASLAVSIFNTRMSQMEKSSESLFLLGPSP